MSSPADDPFGAQHRTEERYVAHPIVPENVAEVPRGRIPMLPVILFLASFASTYALGGWAYALPVIGILVCHEFGHYIQARRYHVPASLPYFIPFPLGPIGTLGAVIGMRGHMGNRKALFDIGISGPLAGLVPTLVCCFVGLSWSTVAEVPLDRSQGLSLGSPLIFQWLEQWYFGSLPDNQTVYLHQIGYAGWVGVFLTALNLIPIGQLDGGHVLYALLRKKARVIAWLLLAAALVGVIVAGRYEWSLMLFLLLLIGPNHPPTADDEMPLGTGRIILGWLTLGFVIIGFTPRPFII